MKSLTIFVAIVVFSSCVTSQFLDTIDDEEIQWSGYSKAPSKAPTHKHNPHEQIKKCFFSYKMVTKCLSKALTKRPTIDSESDCCATIEKLNEN
ncbi:unnamed protein product, partial [Eruca vesicaria subsp. sativa]|nr:unnamed protein product [Eruca vesicaria subsp. sativa]